MTHMMHALICDGEGCTQPGHPPRIRHDATSGHVTVEMHGETFVILDLGDIATLDHLPQRHQHGVSLTVEQAHAVGAALLSWAGRKRLAAAERQLERAKP